MATICDAVDYAHQRGVLHRDLKPANILVDRQGRPYLLDFGLGKTLDLGSQRAMQATLSEPGQLLGTLGYMSPEQSRGQLAELSVRSDVYSLGVIAYELLTGRLPCLIDGPLGDVLQRIANDDPPRPSALNRAVGRDLDAILLKALHKSPAARYASAAELAADVRRQLSGESISARPAGAAELAWRWVRRNRAVAGVGLAAGALLMIIVATSFVRIRHERDQAKHAEARERDAAAHAQREATRAQQTSALLQETLASLFASESGGKPEDLSDALDRVAIEIAQHPPDDPEVELPIRYTLARIYGDLLRPEKAAVHGRRLVELHRARGDGAATAVALRQLGDTLFAQGDARAALHCCRESAALRQPLDQAPDAEGVQLLCGIGWSLVQLGEEAEAERNFKEALASAPAEWGEQHYLIANGLWGLGRCAQERGEFAEWEGLCRRAVAICRDLFGQEGQATTFLTSELAGALLFGGDPTSAERLARATLTLQKRLHVATHPNVAQTLGLLGASLTELGGYQEGEQALREAVLSFARTEHRLPVGYPNDALLAECLRRRGDVAAADAASLRAWQSGRLQHGVASAWIGLLATVRAAVLHDLGQPADAEILLREALEGFVQRPDHPWRADALARLAAVLAEQGALEEAQSSYDEVLRIRRTYLPEGHRDIAAPAAELAQLLVMQADAAQADPLIDEGLTWARTNALSPDVVGNRCRMVLGACLTSLGRFDEAEPLLRESKDAVLAVRGASDPLVHQALQHLADLYEAWGQPGRAAEYRSLLEQTSWFAAGPP